MHAGGDVVQIIRIMWHYGGSVSFRNQRVGAGLAWAWARLNAYCRPHACIPRHCVSNQCSLFLFALFCAFRMSFHSFDSSRCGAEDSFMPPISESYGGHFAFNYWVHPPDNDSFEQPYKFGFWDRDWAKRGLSLLPTSEDT